ncbi:MAG: hypothetical protein HKN26_14455, partial [Acidimicrobiales bacterium]|nr:hypothetical protein [Acidimicrobiales bacterium]
REFAKLGLLYLRGGVWDDRQLLDRHWVDYVRAGSAVYPRYAGQWWRLRGGGDDPRFQATGLYGQGIAVLPDLDLVVAFNGGGGNIDSIVELFESAEPAECPA